MKKKIISLFLITILAVLNLPTKVFAKSTTPINWNRNSEAYKRDLEIIQSQDYKEFINKEGFDKPLFFNWNIYRNPYTLQKIVYGMPQDVSNNENKYSNETECDEWRYLGFNIHKQPVHNQNFPNEVPKSGNPKYWHITTGYYVNSNEAKDSWRNLNRLNNDLFEYNRNAPLIGHGLTESDNWSAAKFGGESKTKLETTAGLFSGGTIVVEHTEGGSKRYATFDTEPLGSEQDIKEELTIDGHYPASQFYTIETNKESITLNLKVDGEITPKGDTKKFYTPNLVKEYNTKIISYRVDEGEKIPINAAGDYDGNFKSSCSYPLELSRNLFTSDKTIFSVTIKWGRDFESVLNEQDPREYETTICINVEDKSIPKARIIADNEVYVGDKVKILGEGEDRKYSPNKLMYNWTCPKGIQLNSSYPNIGGNIVFNKKGEYVFYLDVSNPDGEHQAAAKTIKVIEKGEVSLNLTADNNPKEIKIDTKKDNKNKKSNNKENNIQKIKINAEGFVKGLEASHKNIKKLELIAAECPKDYTKGSEINLNNVKHKNATVYGKTNISKDFSFDVDITTFIEDKENVEYTQYFKVFLKAYFDDGTEKEVSEELKSTFYKLFKPKEPPKNQRPIPTIRAPREVIMGDDVRVRGSVIEPDGDKYKASWWCNDWFNLQGEMQDFDETGGTVWFKYEDEDGVKVVLSATDEKGLEGEDEKRIKVLPAIPKPDLTITGKRKINRKLTLDVRDRGGCSKRYPCDWNKVKWEIKPLENQNINSIKTLSKHKIMGTSNKKYMYLEGHFPEINILLKETGKYHIKVSLQSTAGEEYTAYTERIITVEGDEPPIAKCAITETIIRDPNDNNYATGYALDDSKSIDGDEIGKRIWFLCIDTNNDEKCHNEQWYVFHNEKWVKVQQFGINSKVEELENIDMDKINDGNKIRVEFKHNKVGHFFIGLMIREKLTDDEIIKEFITTDDMLTSNSFHKEVN